MADVDSRTLPPLPDKPGENWVSRSGGLPDFVVRIAKHLQAKGHSTSTSIAIAVSQAKKVCATGRTFGGKTEVSADARARYCNAVKQWEALKAKNRSKSAAKDVREALVTERRLPSGIRLTEDEIQTLVQECENRLVIAEGLLLTLNDKAPRSAKQRAAETATLLLEGKRRVEAPQVDVQAAQSALTREVSDLRLILEATDTKEADKTEKKEAAEKKPAAEKKLVDFTIKQGAGTDGDPHSIVQQLQTRLTELGYVINSDGRFGPVTYAALTRFQEDAGLKPHGEVDPLTVRAMRNPPQKLAITPTDDGPNAFAPPGQQQYPQPGQQQPQGPPGQAQPPLPGQQMQESNQLQEWQGNRGNFAAGEPAVQHGEHNGLPSWPLNLREGALNYSSCRQCVHYTGGTVGKCLLYHYPVAESQVCDSIFSLSQQVVNLVEAMHDRSEANDSREAISAEAREKLAAAKLAAALQEGHLDHGTLVAELEKRPGWSKGRARKIATSIEKGQST
jgi:peptidoglycan hydrolase-like protein with peptidoglycan-binding domain